jgi:hypothetical protein
MGLILCIRGSYTDTVADKEEKIQRSGVFDNLNAQGMDNFPMEIGKDPVLGAPTVHSKRDGNFIRVVR